MKEKQSPTAHLNGFPVQPGFIKRQTPGFSTPIKVKMKYVSGDFDTESGQIVCVANAQKAKVSLCFKSNMNIPFAEIRLYDSGLYKDAVACFEDAETLGKEIERVWNESRRKSQRDLKLRFARKSLVDIKAIVGSGQNDMADTIAEIADTTLEVIDRIYPSGSAAAAEADKCRQCSGSGKV